MTVVTTEKAIHRAAYREYLSLGGSRTLESLHAHLVRRWGEEATPAMSTLHSWSSAFSWQSRVVDDMEMIESLADQRVREDMASEAARRKRRRLQIADAFQLGAMKSIIDRGDGQPIELSQMDAKTLGAIVQAVRHAAETQRIDNPETTPDQSGDDPLETSGLFTSEGLAEIRRFMLPDGEMDGAAAE